MYNEVTMIYLVTDLKPLPILNRIPGLKLSGQAFADTLMVFEFLHNFGETLGFGKYFVNVILYVNRFALD